MKLKQSAFFVKIFNLQTILNVINLREFEMCFLNYPALLHGMDLFCGYDAFISLFCVLFLYFILY